MIVLSQRLNRLPFRMPAALVACLLAGSLARDGCGSSIMVVGVQDHADRSVARQEIPVSITLHHRHAPKDTRFPCSGPNCSRGHYPLPDSRSTITAPLDEWGSADGVTLASVVDDSSFVCISLGARAIQDGDSIYHPPR
jgi:hypothetical protein